MKLLGAREFIKMPTGTFYVDYWKNSESECIQIIEKFKDSLKEFLNIKPDDLHVFGDNSGSMMFDGKEDDYMFYYDANVVGDAGPSTTLYLVINEDELPNEIELRGCDDCIVKLSKKDIIEIRDIFVNKVYSKGSMDKWAIEELDKLSNNGNKIVNVNIDSVME